VSTKVIACEVFRAELNILGVAEDQIQFLEMGLHDNPPVLTQRLQETIEVVDAEAGVDRILLAYGNCGSGTIGIRALRSTLVIPKAHDCIALFLGSNQRYESEQRRNAGSYYFTPGWLNGGRVPGPEREAWLRKTFVDKYEDDEDLEDLIEADRELFASYHSACFVDSMADQHCAQRCAQCAMDMNWRFRRLQGTLDWLKQLLDGPHLDERFLVVQPGQQIVASSVGDLMRAETDL